MHYMRNHDESEIVITGIGITSAIGQGKKAFTEALMQGKHAFKIMERSGRQNGTAFIGAEIPNLEYPDCFSKRLLRTASLSAKVAMITLNEAFEEAHLKHVDPERIGLVIGGSNLQQRELIELYEQYRDNSKHIRPTYAMTYMDSDLCGICTEQFGIKGFAHMIGSASASGQSAIQYAVQAVKSGQVDICIAMGALADLSYLEFQAFRSLGAMGSDKYANEPKLACRPFDKNRDGFIYGESCGAVVIEKVASIKKRSGNIYASITGMAVVLDGNRNPNPSLDGEVKVIKKALKEANLSPSDIDYINPHGTGSIIGDEIELKAIFQCGLSQAYINATKSITGHGLSAAGTVEVIATLLQMKEAQLHPTRNLQEPIEPSLRWVKEKSISYRINNAISLSMGFGGINTAICLKNMMNCGGEDI